MSTISDDRCTDIILDFIAGGVPGNPMGESAGNYNAYFGGIRSRRDLSVLTLDGIYEFQAAMLKRDPRSTAIGRYQFLKRTLRELQVEMKLSGATLFSPELQDQLAVKLLVRRGYSAWWSGEIDDAEFSHRLSKEWASLPDPKNGGKSHYDGDAVGNHASTKLSLVYAMLRQARAVKDGAIEVAVDSAEALKPEIRSPRPKPIPPAPIDRDLVADLVRALQRAVGTKPDGILGLKTRCAVEAAQRRPV